MGGCDPGRHTFTGETCQALAREWATVIDGAVVNVLRGPAVVEDQGRSVLLRQALVVATVDLTRRLDELEPRPACDLDEFMTSAEPLFSPELRAGVGEALFDGQPSASYEDWLEDVRQTVRIIDDDA